ncbi:transcription termination factor Rho [Candidatus Xenohaliotis californiensis]
MNSAADKDKSSEDTEDNNTNSNNASNIAEDDKDSLANVSVEIAELRKRDITSLLDFSSQIGADVAVGMAKQDILMSILKRIVFAHGSVIGSGMIEILPEGFGFLRSTECNYVSCANDIYVSSNQIRKFGLRTGDMIKGMVRAPKRGERYFALQKVLDVNNDSSHSSKYRVNFDDLIPLYPVEKINLECDMQSTISSDISSRIVDLIAPLGKGQRALIVAPPRTGKTILMQNIAHSISTNHPDISLIVLLIDERPEEVTDMSRSVKGEVISSTFDEPAIRHVQLANMVIEKAKRMVERKKDVVILLDSITRLARAYNTVVPSSGKVLTGGVDANALQRPKRFFGAARNIEQGGSLTIIATALVETGSRMDEVIFEEFKGTGNSEIVLDRKIADKRIFPAIDITRSSTRKEELLVDKAILGKMWVLRRLLVQMAPLEAIEFLRDKIKQSKSNCDFFNLMNN